MTGLDIILYIPSRILGLVLGAAFFPLRAIAITSLSFAYHYGYLAIEWALSPLNLLIKSIETGSLFGFLATIIGGAIALAIGLVGLAFTLPFGLAIFAIGAAYNIVSSVFEGMAAGLDGGVVGFWNAFITFDSPFASPEESTRTNAAAFTPRNRQPVALDTDGTPFITRHPTQPARQQPRVTRGAAPLGFFDMPDPFRNDPFFQTMAPNLIGTNPQDGFDETSTVFRNW